MYPIHKCLKCPLLLPLFLRPLSIYSSIELCKKVSRIISHLSKEIYVWFCTQRLYAICFFWNWYMERFTAIMVEIQIMTISFRYFFSNGFDSNFVNFYYESLTVRFVYDIASRNPVSLILGSRCVFASLSGSVF